MSAVLLGEINDFGGDQAVAELLNGARSSRTPAYLTDITNWISYDEANALWEAGIQLTHHPHFPRLVGERAARRLKGSPVAALLRSLGSPEAVYRQMSVTATKFSTVSRLEATDSGPGFATISSEAVGFPRSQHHCDWTVGLLSCTTALFGLPPARVEHPECEVCGAARCIYRITWDADHDAATAASSERLDALGQQVEAMRERLQSMFATASDLIASDDIADVLARITDRAALEVRAPNYLLAVRLEAGGEVHCHHRGLDHAEVSSYAEMLLEPGRTEFPDSWLVVPVASDRREYGRLMAAFDADGSFFPQERELFEVYARYAASALDGAAALREAKRRYDESSALLRLARALASAGTSQEVAQRLADAVPLVVDCDRVGVYLWDPIRGELVRRAMAAAPDDPLVHEEWATAPSEGGPLEQFLNSPGQDPVFVDGEHGDPVLRTELRRRGEAAAILVPISTPDSFLGLLGVSVIDGPQRVKPYPELLNRLSGVAAQATTALQNGRLVDQITHQAMHDQLTGLPNRSHFSDELRKAVSRARQLSELVTVFYIDLDGFKPVNDEFGHDVGDRLLVAIGQRMVDCTRSSDTVARLGGDEFAVLIADAGTPADLGRVGDRLAAAFERPFSVEGHDLCLAASIGRATYPLDADSADGLLRMADASMFAAKRSAVSQR